MTVRSTPVVVSDPADGSAENAAISAPRFIDRLYGREARFLADLPVAARAANIDYLALMTVFGRFPDAALTPYEGIVARYQPQNLDSTISSLPTGRTAEEAAPLLRTAIDRTLDRVLRTVSCAAVLTGGGLDSGGLLAAVHAWAKRTGRTCFAVAIDFEGPYDDRPYLRALEQTLPCRVVRIAPEEGAAFFGPAFYEGADHAPLPSPTVGFEMAAYARAAQEGADCLLTGVGGDQLFDGLPRSVAAMFREQGARAAIDAIRRLRGFPRPRRPYLDWLVRPFLVSRLPASARAFIVRAAPYPIMEWSGPALRASRAKEVRRRRREVQDLVRRGPMPVTNNDRVFARHAQQMVRATGIPRRIDPYLDPSLKTFVHRLPPHWLLMRHVRRGLFREALRDILPEVLYRRLDKAGFEPAMLRTVQAAGGFEVLRPFADTRALTRLGIVEPAPFRSEFERLVAEPMVGRYWPRVWPVLALEAFVRHHFPSHG